MKTLEEIQILITKQKPVLYQKFGVVEIGIFGSYTRREETPESDIDLLIELERPARISLLGLIELEEYLGEVLGVKVDIAIKKNLRKRIGQRILEEYIPV